MEMPLYPVLNRPGGQETLCIEIEIEIEIETEIEIEIETVRVFYSFA